MSFTNAAYSHAEHVFDMVDHFMLTLSRDTIQYSPGGTNIEGAYFLIRSFRTKAYRYEWCSETLVFGKTDQNFDTRA